MPTSNMLCVSLQLAIDLSTQSAIINHLWQNMTTIPPEKSDFCWNAYFSHYKRQCDVALADQGKHMCARSHQDIIHIGQLVSSEPSKNVVKEKLRQKLTTQRSTEEEDAMLDSSIVVTVRLLAMVNIGSLPMALSSRFTLLWNEGTLKANIHEYFNSPQDVNDDNIILKCDFTARNVYRVAGIGIIWTDNLLDHLRLVEGDKKLCIFHHVTFLRWMKHIKSPMYPAGFVEETLDTLKLLFPSNHSRSKSWLESECRTETTLVDEKLQSAGSFKANHRSRHLEHYRFWRERLGALSEAYEEATPTSKALLKALSDRKRGEGWLNSWVAIVAICFTLFFGLVQSIEGAIQVYKAYHSASS